MSLKCFPATYTSYKLVVRSRIRFDYYDLFFSAFWSRFFTQMVKCVSIDACDRYLVVSLFVILSTIVHACLDPLFFEVSKL